MTKVLVAPRYKKEIEEVKNYVDGYVIGIKNYTVNYSSFLIDEVFDIIDFCNKNNKEIFVVLNKNIHNNDLDDLKKILNKLKNINGVIFYDNCIINLRSKLNLNYDLVWSSEHQVTNYQTINYYNDYNVKYALLSSDITLREVFEIKKNVVSRIILPVFGYLPMFVSQRHLVKNYLQKFKLNDKSSINYMEKENKIYPLIDNKLGTMVYSDSIYSILDELDNIKSNKIDYILLNGYLIDGFTNIVKTMKYDNACKYFCDIETVYKVK